MFQTSAWVTEGMTKQFSTRNVEFKDLQVHIQYEAVERDHNLSTDLGTVSITSNIWISGFYNEKKAKNNILGNANIEGEARE